MPNYLSEDEVFGSAPAAGYLSEEEVFGSSSPKAAYNPAKDSQAASAAIEDDHPAQPQEIATSAHAWRGAAGGRGTAADPRRLDVNDGFEKATQAAAVEKSVKELRAINPGASDDQLYGMANSAYSKQDGAVNLAGPGNQNTQSFMDESRGAVIDNQRRERIQRKMDENPISNALASGLATSAIGVANAPQALINAPLEIYDRIGGALTGEKLDAPKVPKWWFTKEAMDVAASAMPTVANKDVATSWRDGDFGTMILANMAANAPSTAMSMAAMFVPPLRAAVLPAMGAMSTGTSYSQGDSAVGSVLKGAVEVGTEMLPLQAFDRIHDVLSKLPLPSQKQALAIAGQKIMKAGSTVGVSSLTNFIEEAAAQVGGNVVDRYVEGEDTSIGDGALKAGLIGAFSGAGHVMPRVASIAAAPGSREGAAAAAFADAMSGDLTGPSVVERLRVEPGTSPQISPQSTVRSFADPSGPASQAGITPVAVPIPSTSAPNVSTPNAPTGLDQRATVGGSDPAQQGVGATGLVAAGGAGVGDGATGFAGDIAEGAPLSRQDSEPSASVKPISQTSDSDLLGRIPTEQEPLMVIAGSDGRGMTQGDAKLQQESYTKRNADADWKIEPMDNGNFRVAGYQKAEQAPQATQPQQAGQQGTPATIWTGRSGAGYETTEAAQQALETRTRKDPELDWKVEQRPDGKYHLAGYAQQDAAQPAAQAAPGTFQTRQEAGADQQQRGLAGSTEVVDTAEFGGSGFSIAPSGQKETVGELREQQAAVDSLARAVGASGETGSQNIEVVGNSGVAPTPAQSRARRIVGVVGAVAKTAFKIKTVAVTGINGYGVAHSGYAMINADDIGSETDSTNSMVTLAIGTIGHEAGHVSLEQSKDPEDRKAYLDMRLAIHQHLQDGVIDKQEAIENEAAAKVGAGKVSKEYAHNEVIQNINGAMWLDSKFWGRLYDIDPSSMRRVAYRFMQAATKFIKAAKGSDLDINTMVKNVDAVREIVAKTWADKAMRQGKPVSRTEIKKAMETDPATESAFKRKGVIGEVAPNPDQETSKEWDSMSSPEKTQANRDVGRKVAQGIMDLMGVKGWDVSMSTGTYEGKTNPNFIITAPEGATQAQVDEFAKLTGYVLDQKAMVTFDENNTEGENLSGFVKVVLPQGMPESKIAELRAKIGEVAKAAGDDTLRDGALVFGNFRDESGKPFSGIEDDAFRNQIKSAVEQFDYDGEFNIKEVERFKSDLIWPDSREGYLEGTRYGESNREQGGQGERGDGVRGRSGGDLAQLRKLAEEATGRRQQWIDSSASGKQRAEERGRSAAANGSGADGQGVQYGSASPGSVKAVGVHYSQQKRNNLSSSFGATTGLKGLERERLSLPENKDIKPRINFYVDSGKGVTPEAGVGGVKHVVNLNNLYDIKADKLGIVKNVKGASSAERASKIERLVMQAGFDGYLANSNGGQQDFAVLIGKHEIPMFKRRTKPVEDFNDIGNINELGSFDLDRQYAESTKDDFSFPDLSAADAKLDAAQPSEAEMAERLREELEDAANFKRLLEEELGEAGFSVVGTPKVASTSEKNFAEVKPAQIKAEGLMAEEAYPDLEYSKDPYDPLVERAFFVVNGQRYKATISSGSPKIQEGAFEANAKSKAKGFMAGYELSGLSEKAKKDWNKRFAASADLMNRSFDIYTSIPAQARENVLKAWKAIAANKGAFEFARADGAKGATVKDVAQDIADKMMAGGRYKVTIGSPDYHRGTSDFSIMITDTKTGTEGSADVEFWQKEREVTMHTHELDKGSGLGKPVYQIGQAFADKFKARINADGILLGVNNYRRTEQMFSGMLRSGNYDTMQPGVGQRIYGWNERAKTQEQMDRNMVRTGLAATRNVLEFAPEMADIGFDLAKNQFYFRNKPDSVENRLMAGSEIKSILSNSDVRVASISRSTLARAAVTLEAMDGALVVPDNIAAPVLYKRKQRQLDERTDVAPMLDELGRALRSQSPSSIDKVMGRIGDWRKSLNQVNEADFQDEMIDVGSRAIGVALKAGVKETDPRSVPVPIGATPHVLSMLGFDMSPLRVDSRIVGKILNGKHSADFAGVTPQQFVEAIYNPVLVTKLQAKDEVEIVTSISSPEDGLPVIFMVKRGAEFKGQRGENGAQMKPLVTHSLMSAYSKPSFWGIRLRDAMKSGALLYANVGELQSLESKNPALGRVLSSVGASQHPKQQTAKPVAAGAASLPPSSNGESLRNERANVSIGSAQSGLVAPSASRLTKDIAKSVMAGNVKGYGDLVKWVSQNYDGEGDQMPMFKRKSQTDTPEFKSWFGDSKVVDADGKPLVVYHGSNHNIDVFDFSRARDGAHWFTPMESHAASFGGNVHAVYISMSNPMEIDQDRLDAAWDAEHPSGEQDDRELLPRHFVDKFVEQAKAKGHDGLIIREMGDREIQSDMYLPFEPSQIKSATGNNGDFDGGNPDIRYKRKQPIKRAPGMKDESWFMEQRRRFQDQFIQIREVQNMLTARGGVVGEAQDVYRAEERMHGRAQELLNDFAQNQIEPFIKKAAKAGIGLDEIALYAYAKHAQERNAYIESINPKIGDAGSGMSNDHADNIIQLVSQSGDSAAFDDLHQDLMGITSTTRRVLLDEGLITPEEYKGWEDLYENYVPLRGFEDVDHEAGTPLRGTGRGFSMTGKESVKALGRTSKAGDILENIIRDYERAVIRSEKNSVAKTFLDLATSNPDPTLWEVQPVKVNRSFNKASGMVLMTRTPDTGDETVAIKVAGQQVRVKINDLLVLRAMKLASKDETSQLEQILANTLGTYTNLMRNTLTRYNPIFGFVNAVRDAQMGAVSAYDELGAEGAKLYAKHLGPAMAASFRMERGKADPANRVMDRWIMEMRFAGGTTGGYHMRDTSEITDAMRTMMLQAGASPNGKLEAVRATSAYKGAQAAMKWLEIWGSTSEDAARVAAYRAAREMGKTPAQAASIAKNLTTNFNRKGEWGTTLNSMYLFFNAGVQGSTRVIEALGKPRVRYMMAGLTAAAMTIAMLNAGAGDDDDGQNYWDKIPDYEKERNMIFMLPPGVEMEGASKVGTRGRYIKIPMPYGINVFPVLGNQIADMARWAKDPMRGKSPAKAGVNLTSAVFGSINPFGGSLDVTKPIELGLAVAPTAADLGIQLAAGVNGFGRPVGPEKSPFDSKPDSENFSARQAGTASQNVARWLNSVTGGNEGRSGAVDIMPGTIDNVVRNTTGGLGVFLADTFVNLPSKVFSPVEVTSRDAPLLRNFYGQIDGVTDQGLFYDRRAEVTKEAQAAQREMKLGIEVDYSDEALAKLALAKVAESYTKWMTALRKEEIEVAQNDKLTRGEKMVKRREIEKQREEAVRSFNVTYNEEMRSAKVK